MPVSPLNVKQCRLAGMFIIHLEVLEISSLQRKLSGRTEVRLKLIHPSPSHQLRAQCLDRQADNIRQRTLD